MLRSSGATVARVEVVRRGCFSSVSAVCRTFEESEILPCRSGAQDESPCPVSVSAGHWVLVGRVGLEPTTQGL